MAGHGIDEIIPELGGTVGQVLLTPTVIYARALRHIQSYYRVKSVVHGIAHITGGGLAENLGRIVPAQTDVEIEAGSWQMPPVFGWLQRLGDIEDVEMERVFNRGIGMALVVSAYYANQVTSLLKECGLESWTIGRVIGGSGQVIYRS